MRSRSGFNALNYLNIKTAAFVILLTTVTTVLSLGLADDASEQTNDYGAYNQGAYYNYYEYSYYYADYGTGVPAEAPLPFSWNSSTVAAGSSSTFVPTTSLQGGIKSDIGFATPHPTPKRISSPNSTPLTPILPQVPTTGVIGVATSSSPATTPQITLGSSVFAPPPKGPSPKSRRVIAPLGSGKFAPTPAPAPVPALGLSKTVGKGKA